jgi:ABC-type branched-subunit amino acid transport system substrate-binding protein
VNRRSFLGGVLSTGLASIVLPQPAARAQAGEIRIGMSAAFRGAAAGLGSELHRGAQAYYNEINARGGLFGRQITVVALDDGYNPDPCIRNTIQLLDREKVFLLSNYVGTPTLTRALPVIKQYADQAVVLVGNFTGAQPQREAPYVDQVFNIRASYRQEMAALVERFWQAGARRFGVYY